MNYMPNLPIRLRRSSALSLAALAALLLLPAVAQAASPELLTQVPEDGKPGTVAGRMNLPRGVAVDPNVPGHVYIVDGENARIDEFTAWGEFVKAWGWEVNASAPAAEMQSCTVATGCRKGSEGSGAGQFKQPEAIAVGPEGDVYVIEAVSHRVQKFDPTAGIGEEEAEFLLSFGESGLGQLEGSDYGSRLVISPTTGRVFVGEAGRIRVFAANGTFLEAIEGGNLAGESVRALATGPDGSLYVAFQGRAGVHKLKPNGPSGQFQEPSFAPESEAERPFSLAVDGAGNLYVDLMQEGIVGEPWRVQGYDIAGKCLMCGKAGEGGLPGFDRSASSQVRGVAVSGACGAQLVYLVHFSPLQPLQSFLRVYGDPPNPALCPQPKVPPQITAQFASAAESRSGEVTAQINSRFFTDTNYRVEYGTSPCKTGGCTKATTTRTLTSQVTSKSVRTENISLEGLDPGTTYHYRFVAESGGGGPVYGVDPDGSEGPEEADFADGTEATFTTYRETQPLAPCANDGFRTGASAVLSDCRAYELVSPLDKEGGDIAVLPGELTVLPAVLQESAANGGRLAYGTYRAFGDAGSAPWTSQYVASRIPGSEWRSHAISPPRGRNLFEAVRQTRPEYKAFSDDLCTGWFGSFSEVPLAEAGSQENPNLYRRTDDECGGPTYTPLNTTAVAPSPLELELQGLSADGETAAFLANRVLAPGGSAGNTQLYGRRGKAERLLCVLPGGVANSGSCTAGWLPEVRFTGQQGQMKHAISADGNRVYWTAAGSGGGRIYLRENPFGTGGECANANAPCTKQVSKTAEEARGTSASQFWAASEDGSKAIFETGGTLYEYRREDESTHEMAGELLGVMGQSEDLSRVYLASREAKGGVNAEGAKAVAGEANLYLYEGGAFRFVAALTAADLAPNYSPVAGFLNAHFARVSPNGGAAAFMSAGSPTGYDTTDRTSGQPDTEVYLYRAVANGGAGGLVCASCNPSEARPAGQESKIGQSYFQAASQLLPPESVLYAARMLSADGNRLYFESYDALTPADTNGRRDVYQWEAPGSGNCNEAVSSSYSTQNGGCIDLISSGKSASDSGFVDASATGDDVFFTTASSLLAKDYGLIDIYDARSGGGLPQSPAATTSCEGEACQSPPPSPEFATPASQIYRGSGNAHEQLAKKKHKKHKKAKKAKRNKHGAKRHKRHHRQGSNREH